MPIDRVTVGSVEIVRVTDGTMTGRPAFFFSGIPPSMYEPALGDDLKPNGLIDIEFGSFLVRSSGKTLLIDTGMGNKRGSSGGRLLDEQLLVAAGHFASGGFGRLVMADGKRNWRTL